MRWPFAVETPPAALRDIIYEIVKVLMLSASTHRYVCGTAILVLAELGACWNGHEEQLQRKLQAT
jgi:hypothetical protein